MSFSLLPTVIMDRITQITPAMLKERGIRLLMLDFDNTIVPYTTSVPSEEVSQWLSQMRESDVQICVVSNSRKDRVCIFCEKYGIDCITHAAKPFQDGIRRCLEKFGIEPGSAGIVGDQIFTDTLGGNCAGMTTFLVRAIDNHNIWLKLRHVAELPFIFLGKNRRFYDEQH